MYRANKEFNLIFRHNLIIYFYLHKAKNIEPNQTYFHETWLSDSRLMKWIVQSVSKENSHDKLCQCHVSLPKNGYEGIT